MTSTWLMFLGIGAAIVLLVLFLWVVDYWLHYDRDPYDEIDC